MKDAIKDTGVEVGHKDKANSDSDEASKFHFVVAINATGNVVRDLFIEDNHGSTGGHN